MEEAPLGRADVAVGGARGNSLDRVAAAVRVSAGKPIDFPCGAAYPRVWDACSRAGVQATLTVRPCVRWPRRTISRPRRRGRGSCRAPARTRSPSCGKSGQQRVRKAASDAQRVSRDHGTYYLQLVGAELRRRQLLARPLSHYSTCAIAPIPSGVATHEGSARAVRLPASSAWTVTRFDRDRSNGSIALKGGMNSESGTNLTGDIHSQNGYVTKLQRRT